MNKDDKRGEFLQFLRKKKGLTQSELAEMIHYSDKNISKWETGKSFPSNPNVIEKLSQIFEVSFEELMYGEFKTEVNEKKITNNVKEEYLSSYNTYNKIIRYTFIGVLMMTIIFLISIYFIYIKNSVYYYSANIKYGHEQNKMALLITNKINVFNFHKLDDPDELINELIFYYKNGDEDKIVFKGRNDDYYILENNGYNEFDFKKLIKSDAYLIIKYKDKTETKMDVKFQIDYNNDNIFPEKDIDVLKEKNIEISPDDLIKKLEKMGFQNHGLFYSQEINDSISCKYYPSMSKLEITIANNGNLEKVYAHIDDQNIHYERLDGEIPETNIIDETGKMNCNNEKCETISDLAKYINYLRYE